MTCPPSSPSRGFRLLRVIGPVGLFLLLGGPTPGSIGSCSDTDPFADFEEFCESFESIRCFRLMQPPNQPCEDVPGAPRCFDAQLCAPENIARDCRTNTWDTWAGGSCSPPPTTEEANLCLRVLIDPASRYGFEVEERTVPECRSLCE